MKADVEENEKNVTKKVTIVLDSKDISSNNKKQQSFEDVLEAAGKN